MSIVKTTVLSACRQMLTPIIGILLRNGITYKELAQLCKQLYVDIATKEFGIRGRETNQSRVAIMTGIERKEVARIKSLLKENSESEIAQVGQDRMTRVLTAWHSSPQYIDANHHPLQLPIDGPAPSFQSLIDDFAGDMPASTLLKEFKRCGVIEATDDNRLRVLKRFYIPSQSDPAALLRAGSVLFDVANTLEHNLYKANSTEQKPLRFERRATNIQMPANAEAAFREFVEAEGQAFLEKIDTWLTEHEANSESADSKKVETIRLGVGTYFINSNKPEN